MARQPNKLKSRDTFFIITNGKETETNYFNLLKEKKSIYDVKVIFDNADPVGLVQSAIRYLSEANQVWCVFDIDYTAKDNRLVPALKLAEQNGIKVAYSNVAFEVWLISHFEKCDRPLEIKDYQKILDKYLEPYDKKYDKADNYLLKECFIPKYGHAVTNSKVVYQKLLKQHRIECGENSRPPIWKWNSSTTVYKLVEALMLKIKESPENKE